ncbi:MULTISPECIES: carbohydrate porin [unclassified Mucilaginibacter]|uniref:carbohydrate porin n=1 Tax=unclassified Mucilaginibacter TaxID=2617802 RepID=UPI002AC94667|nr:MULTISPECIES: carbohydrate porin [unclassified Mucilaginibacter]MEB0260446.1 carbohydrate porin [Mucilaginibacter sp. 10I4]MEB0280027.1 carbohydrate porin [Mucilaginibacter sp. 10B2]MEB0301335.1 carbohydrate porin [Mucilaginibacter sp. 5C4]WPX23631.1 carbohydrate porin [Mucilaginibacter sp. 5C4]
MKKTLLSLTILLGIAKLAAAQDTIKTQRFNLHFQQTIIMQYKPQFSAPYTGQNSLIPNAETQTSLTSTLFGGARLWKGAEAYLNPELSGGSGLSKTLGIAGFPNGETFRIGAAEPKIYLARLYLTQYFNFGDEKEYIEDDVNQLAGMRSKRYLKITAGKFGMADFFDGNEFSHDPRSQFMNWSLMDNAAWDYPANTRGYVIGAMADFAQPNWNLRFAFTMTTTTANGSTWDEHLSHANTQTLEYERRYTLNGHKGTLRLLGFRNNGIMGVYRDAINLNPAAPDVDATQGYGRHKYGFGINADQYLSDDFGVFAKASYNDGKTETWAFTEIDRSISLGAVLKGNRWSRKDDELGLAFVGNGISNDHKDYLAAGGYGFIIGDGQLNYSPELIAEVYYKINAYQHKLWISPDYQFIANPAYNKDRGPVNVLSVRAHVEF